MSDLNSDLNLEEFIYQVRKELLDAQEKHKGELGYFELKNVELEVTVTAERTSEGILNLHVVQIGSDVSKAHVHSVKLTFSIVPQPEKSKGKAPYDILKYDISKDASSEFREVKPFGIDYMKCVTPLGPVYLPPPK